MKGLTDMNTAYIKLDRDAAQDLKIEVAKLLRNLLDEDADWDKLENEYYNLPRLRRWFVYKPKKPLYVSIEIERLEDIYNILSLGREMYFSAEDYLYVKGMIAND